MTLVKNLNGTTDNRPPYGFSSWKDWWEAKTGRRFGFCSCSSCSQRATVGAHVQKVGMDRKWYIVPLCGSCNTGKKNVQFYVADADLVAVNP
jgi:hypothetical protein